MALTAGADEPAPPAAVPPVVIQQIEGDANGFRVQVQVQGAAVPAPPQRAKPAQANEADEVEIEVTEEAEFGFPGLALPFNGPAGGPWPPGGVAGGLGEMLRAALALQTVPVPAQPAEAADPAEAAPQPPNPARAAELQRQAQLKQQAKQFEQFMQPVLQAELELIRAVCGSLSLTARREILATGREATTKAALGFATRQMNGDHGRNRFEPRAVIQQQLAGALEKRARPDEFAAYQRERQQRVQRRAAAARVRIVSRLDGQLELTAGQRVAIERDLETRWQAAWNAVLDDQGTIINGRPLAPDFCDACVSPHLGEAQKRQWEEWRKAAGTAVVGWGWAGGIAFDGQGLQQADGWWSK